jgi:hypothetical protein
MTQELLVRDAYVSDASKISSLAQDNDLLLDGLTPFLFIRMLEWLYFESPFGKRVQLVAEDSEKKLVAHYGGVPFKFKWGESNYVGLLASNLVVAKDFRKQSPFLALQRSFRKTYMQNDYAFAYGAITRKGVLEPHLRMGWKLAGVLRVYVRPIKANKIFKKISKNIFLGSLLNLPLKIGQHAFNWLTIPASSEIVVQKITKFDNTWEIFLKLWMEEQDICSMRSPEILNWRYFQFIERDYCILAAFKNFIPVGYVALRKMHMKELSSMAIIEIVTNRAQNDVFKALMKESILHAQNAEADLMATALTDHDNLKGSLKKSGFLCTSEKFTIVMHSPKNFLIEPIKNQFYRWRLNWFDHDYV